MLTEKRFQNEFGLSKDMSDVIDYIGDELNYTHSNSFKEKCKEALRDLIVGKKDKSILILKELKVISENAIENAFKREETEGSDHEQYIDAHELRIKSIDEQLNKLE